MTWSWEIGLLVAISVLALVLALIAWRRRYIADLLEASLNIKNQMDLLDVKKTSERTDAELHAHALIQEIDTGAEITGDPKCQI